VVEVGEIVRDWDLICGADGRYSLVFGTFWNDDSDNLGVVIS
jgi:hypothetical protein